MQYIKSFQVKYWGMSAGIPYVVSEPLAIQRPEDILTAYRIKRTIRDQFGRVVCEGVFCLAGDYNTANKAVRYARRKVREDWGTKSFKVSFTIIKPVL